MQKLRVFYLYDTLLLTTEFRSRLYYITTLLSNNYYNEKQKQKTYANPDPIDRHAMRGLYFEFATLPKKIPQKKRNRNNVIIKVRARYLWSSTQTVPWENCFWCSFHSLLGRRYHLHSRRHYNRHRANTTTTTITNWMHTNDKMQTDGTHLFRIT